MVKLFKSFRRQVDKAERAANRMQDPELAAELRTLANAYRSQAESLKKKKADKKPREKS
jgi:hypothetical protein